MYAIYIGLVGIALLARWLGRQTGWNAALFLMVVLFGLVLVYREGSFLFTSYYSRVSPDPSKAFIARASVRMALTLVAVCVFSMLLIRAWPARNTGKIGSQGQGGSGAQPSSQRPQ